MRKGTLNLTASSLPLVCLLLFSCSNDSNTNAPETTQTINLDGLQIRRMAQFEFTSYTDGEGDPPLVTTQAYADFEVFDSVLTPTEVQQIETRLRYKPAGCVISDSADDLQNLLTYPVGKTFNAGDVLPITTPSGSWAELIVSDSQGQPDYNFSADTRPNSAIPAETTISIPGSALFSGASVNIPHVTPVTLVTIQGDDQGRLLPESRVSWQPGPEPDELVLVKIEYDGSDEFGSTYAANRVVCATTDNGQFEFPSDVRNVLAQYNVRSEKVFVTRGAVSHTVMGDALLIVTNKTQSVPLSSIQ